MSNIYKTISKQDVLSILISAALDITSPIECINLVNIANILKTSRYQVKKHMSILVSDGVAELERTVLYDYDGYTLPYCGYRITDTVKIKNGENIEDSLNRTYILQVRAMYQKRKAEEESLLKKCFDL